MARRNKPRAIGGEPNLAARIVRELDARQWSPADLAHRLTDAGCPIQTSAIYKIIKGDPPRKITVDELIALTTVLNTSVDDLLTPVEVLDQQRAKELLQELDEASRAWFRACARLVEVHSEFTGLAADNRELFEFVRGHHFARTSSSERLPEQIADERRRASVGTDSVPDDLLRTGSGLSELIKVEGAPGYDPDSFGGVVEDAYFALLSQAGAIAHAKSAGKKGGASGQR